MISLLVLLVVVGVVLYLVERVIPMDGTIKIIIRCVVLLAVLVYVLSAFGLLSGVNVPRLNN